MVTLDTYTEKLCSASLTDCQTAHFLCFFFLKWDVPWLSLIPAKWVLVPLITREDVWKDLGTISCYYLVKIQSVYAGNALKLQKEESFSPDGKDQRLAGVREEKPG